MNRTLTLMPTTRHPSVGHASASWAVRSILISTTLCCAPMSHRSTGTAESLNRQTVYDFWSARDAPGGSAVVSLPPPPSDTEELFPSGLPQCRFNILQESPLVLNPTRRQRLLLMGLSPGVVTKDEAAVLDDLFETFLAPPKYVAVALWRDIASLVSMEMRKDLLGCTEVTCLAEIGGALAADYIVTAAVAETGGAYVLSVRAIDAEHTVRAATSAVEYADRRCTRLALEQVLHGFLK